MTDAPTLYGDSQATLRLLERARAGDDAARDALFAAALPPLLVYVRARLGAGLGARVEPADVVQDALVAALPALPTFEPRGAGSFVAWLCRIAALRRRGSRRWLQSATSLLALSSLGGLAAEHAWHPFGNAIGSMVAALACGLLALQVARTTRRLAGFGWIPALPLFAAAAGGAAVGLDVLVRGRDVASFTTAVQQTAWADWVAATSGVGVVALAALLLLTGLTGLRRNDPDTGHPVLA